MKLGLMIGSEYTSLRSGVELARSAEQAGFESLWMPEFWRSYSVPVAAVAEATTRIRLGTNASSRPRSEARKRAAQAVGTISRLNTTSTPAIWTELVTTTPRLRATHLLRSGPTNFAAATLAEDHPDRSLTDLLGKPAHPSHDPILSRNGASGKLGAVHTQSATP